MGLCHESASGVIDVHKDAARRLDDWVAVSESIPSPLLDQGCTYLT